VLWSNVIRSTTAKWRRHRNNKKRLTLEQPKVIFNNDKPKGAEANDEIPEVEQEA
jgi:hypothetical protein